MAEDRKTRLMGIFDSALQREGGDRERYIDEACAGDAALARDTRRLITAFAETDGGDGEHTVLPTATMPQSAGNLAPGAILAGRYRIVDKLGEGGMGAVYQAHDQELDRTVALKVIRGELVASRQMLQRFRMEVVVAQKITHRNVVRIFDLGVAGDDRFFTMEFVAGKSLWSLLHERGKLAASEAVNIMAQVSDGLAAAHSTGVVHRDLKPPNIMIGDDGRVAVMDFGIARSLEGTGVTRLGEIVGTPDYMAPEHARGEQVDARSDLFSLGIILYELLTGKLPFPRVAQVGLVKRTEVPATSVSKLDAAIPASLSQIVDRCLALDPENRYQRAEDLVAALVEWQRSQGLKTSVNQIVVAPESVKTSRRWVVGAAAAAGLLGAGGAYYALRRSGPAQQQSPLTVLIADFDNQTGDAQFDGSLEPMFALAMEDASFINCFDRGAARIAATQVRGRNRLDRDTAGLVAVREGIPVVVNGEILRNGNRYTLRVQAVDHKNTSILTREAEAANKNDILKVVARLAGPVRRALGDQTPEAKQLSAETFTAGSLEAARAYAQAQDLALAGKAEDAIKAYQETIRLDPRMGRAYSGLATIYRNTGRMDESVEQFKHALEFVDRMSERERYRTRGGYFVTVNNQAQAAEQYKALVQKFPADSGGHANLALTYLLLRDTAKALEEGRTAIQIHPGNLSQRNNVALYAMYAGKFEDAIRLADDVLKKNPQFPKALLASAVASLGLGRRQEALEFYGRLAGTTLVGKAMSQVGLADMALYEGRALEAVSILEPAVSGPDAAKAPLYAIRLVILAQANLALSKKAPALALAKKAASASANHAVRLPAALIALACGETAAADAAAKDLDGRLTDEMSGYARILEAERLRQSGRPQEAVRKAGDSMTALNLWLGHYYQGLAYLDAKAFPEAQKSLDTCLSRRGEATAVFMDDLPSWRYVAPLHYYAGVAAAGLGGGGREALEKFTVIRAHSDFDDPLLADARKRLAGR